VQLPSFERPDGEAFRVVEFSGFLHEHLPDPGQRKLLSLMRIKFAL
jgi:hypothetical protein